jgi:membrane protease YdiL (CAAX protease family)
VAGLALASAGYPLGRVALGDHPTNPSPEPLWLETVALAGLIAPVEEIVWGALVQPVAGVVATTVLFAAKHVAIDGRWRRSLGLALFGLGLGLLRQRSRKSALLTHSACNAAGVALGHLTGRDQF